MAKCNFLRVIELLAKMCTHIRKNDGYGDHFKFLLVNEGKSFFRTRNQYLQSNFTCYRGTDCVLLTSSSFYIDLTRQTNKQCIWR